MLDSNSNKNVIEELDKFVRGFSYQKKTTEKDEEQRKEEDSCKDHDDEEKVSRKPSPSLKELNFVRLLDPIHIPAYLVEQIKDRLFEVEKFYQYQTVACIIHTENGPQLNATNLLYAIVHERLRQVKGFLWMIIDLLTNSLVINNFSMDKEYWGKGEATVLLEEKAKMVMKDLKLSRIVWITRNPKACEQKGFKRAKDTLMIYEE